MFSTAIAVIFHNATSVHLYQVQLKCVCARGMSSMSSCLQRVMYSLLHCTQVLASMYALISIYHLTSTRCEQCLLNRYGVVKDEADPVTWSCPVCEKKCNCSLCRKKVHVCTSLRRSSLCLFTGGQTSNRHPHSTSKELWL